MYYYKLEMGNGYVTCDEIHLLKTNTPLTEDLFNDYLMIYYSYYDGFAGLDNEWDEEEEEGNYECFEAFWDSYMDGIYENSCYYEIDKAEFDELVEEGWNVIDETELEIEEG